MDQHLPDPNQPLTVSILRGVLEQLEADGYGDTPISQYADRNPSRLIQAHNIVADTSIAARTVPTITLDFCSTWDTTEQGSAITNFILL